MSRRRTLTPVTITERWPSFRHPDRLEIWQAVSEDGEWTYTRLDEVGTPWAIEHSSCDRVVMLAGSLTKARRATAEVRRSGSWQGGRRLRDERRRG